MLGKTFYNQYVRPIPPDIKPKERNKVVERTGYVTTKQRIENMILAGQRLQKWRESQFDIISNREKQYPDIDKLTVDKTRDPGYTVFDAIDDLDKANENLAEAKRKAEEAKLEAEKLQKLEDEKNESTENSDPDPVIEGSDS